HRARYDVEIKPLGRLRLLEHVERKALRRRIGEPLVNSESIALRLGDLLALLVEEKLVVEALGRAAAERGADLGRELHAVDQILARHLVIDGKGRPAHGPVGLPLQLGMPASYWRFEPLAGVGIAPDDRAGIELSFLNRHLHDNAGLRVDWQERRIGLRPLLA